MRDAPADPVREAYDYCLSVIGEARTWETDDDLAYDLWAAIEKAGPQIERPFNATACFVELREYYKGSVQHG